MHELEEKIAALNLGLAMVEWFARQAPIEHLPRLDNTHNWFERELTKTKDELKRFKHQQQKALAK